MAKLSEICSINMGQSPKSSTYNENGIGLPFFQGNADFGELYPLARVWCSKPTQIAKQNDILISVRAPIGALNIADRDCCIGRGLAALTVNPALCAQKYLWYGLKSKVQELNLKGTGSTFKAVGKDTLHETKIPLPPISEQLKIVSTLDKLQSIIAHRQRQLAKLDELVKARFVEMFGKFNENPMKWPVVSFADIAIIDGNMTTDYARYAHYPHIGVDSIEKDTGTLKGYRTVAEDRVISGKYVFTKTHIIYSKIRPNLNKVALPDFDGLCSADAYPILPIDEKCNRVFLAYNMRSPFFLDYILQFCKRTNLPKVNRKELYGFKTPLPPINLQNQFASFVYQVDKSKSAVQKALNESQTLFDSLMQQYFG